MQLGDLYQFSFLNCCDNEPCTFRRASWHLFSSIFNSTHQMPLYLRSLTWRVLPEIAHQNVHMHPTSYFHCRRSDMCIFRLKTVTVIGNRLQGFYRYAGPAYMFPNYIIRFFCAFDRLSSCYKLPDYFFVAFTYSFRDRIPVGQYENFAHVPTCPIQSLLPQILYSYVEELYLVVSVNAIAISTFSCSIKHIFYSDKLSFIQLFSYDENGRVYL